MRPKPYDAPAGFDWIERLAAWKIEQGVPRLDLETAWGRSARLELMAVDARIWRWTFLPGGAARPEPTPCLAAPAKPAVALKVKETDSGLVVTGPRLSLAVGAEPFSMRFFDRAGRIAFSENPDDVDGLGRPFVPPLGILREGRRALAVTQSFHLHPDERLYGLGEKFTRLDKAGQRIVSWTVDALGSTSERSHKNVPFLWSTRGWGLFLDTGARIEWELGTRSCRSFTVRVEDGALDAYLIHGPSPEAILERYTSLTGRAPVPPKWSFGLWVSSGGIYRTQEAVECLVQGLESRRLPASVVHIDPWWMKGRRYCDFRWDRAAFPDPEGMIRRLHERGLRLCLWEHPYISIESDLFEFGKRRGFFVKDAGSRTAVIDYGLSLAPRPDGIIRAAGRSDSWNARVAVIDLTHPGARAWFKDLHRPLLRMGVDVFKTDFGEDIPADAVFHDGRTGAVLHNLYPLLYNQAVFEVTREERGYGLVWSRSGTAGSQRYPVCWSGDPAADWDSLAATVRGGLSAGLSGIPFWSHDIGGYRGTPAPALYVRWAQFGLLCSHSRMHGDGPREPWLFGPRALRIVNRFLRLRLRLFPYFYSLALEAARNGLPVLRALPLAFPGDVNVHGHDLEFMIGPWLLAAPITTPSGERDVYLPSFAAGRKGRTRRPGDGAPGSAGASGLWYDYWTGRVFEGGRVLRVHAPLEKMPLFVRAGAVLPVRRGARGIPDGPPERLDVEVYAGAPSTFILREDEGRTRFTLDVSGAAWRLRSAGWRGKKQLAIRWR